MREDSDVLQRPVSPPEGAGGDSAAGARPAATWRNVWRSGVWRQRAWWQETVRQRPWQRLRKDRRLLVVTLVMLMALLLPVVATVGGAIQEYGSLRALGEDGLQHLLAAKADLEGATSLSHAGASTPSTGLIPTPQAVRAAQDEFQAAQRDFGQIRDRLRQPDLVLGIAGLIPGIGDKITSADALAESGYDVASIGSELTTVALPLLTRLHGGSLLNGQPLLTTQDVTSLRRALGDTNTRLGDLQHRLARVDIASLPLSAAQKAELTRLSGQLPEVRSLLAQGDDVVQAAGWMLGVGQPRHFLVQTLDRAELRSSGGFTGDYGILTIQDGKLQPFSLTDVDRLDYAGNGWSLGRRPPAAYNWWPFANWGLRDANLSPDFPTNARLVLGAFQAEGGGSVDGLINISPVVIEHVLAVTGPLDVPQYGEVITASNLEDKLHYYQQNPAGIAKEQAISAGDTSTSPRKRFTQLVGRLLQDRLHQLPASQMEPLAKQMLADLRSKDIQIFVTNPTVERLLMEHQAAGAVDTTPGVDGFMLVQSNVSVAKSTPFVKVVEHDNVTLDTRGGATHTLTVTMQYTPTGNPYGYWTYRDYVRLYVPPQAQLRSADGFDTGTPLCWTPPPDQPKATEPKLFAGVPACPANPYPAGELVCPAGYYGPGNQAPSVFGSDGKTPWALDVLGSPPETTSDLPGRAMWGGYVVIPPYCTATLTLSWYVPGVAAPAQGIPSSDAPYTLLVQRQSGTDDEVQLTIHPAPGIAAQGRTVDQFDVTLDRNLAFTLGKRTPLG
jgi:hypothetical protein